MKGSQLPQSKLNEAAVRRIRKEYREMQQQIRQLQQEFSVAAYADHYGVSVSNMDKVIRGETWKHVESF